MPYCPQCGAEYTEGIAACHECQVPLVAERPEIVTPVEAKEPLSLDEAEHDGSSGLEITRDKVRRDLTSAWRYTVEAYHFLRRHPALLLLPVCIALFNAVENGVGEYLASTRTTTGRTTLSHARAGAQGSSKDHRYTPSGPSFGTAWNFSKLNSFSSGVAALTSREFSPSLRGTQTLVYEAATNPRLMAFTRLNIGLVFLVLFVSLALVAFITAGYLGSLHHALAAEPSATSAFWKEARAFWVPMALYFIAIGLVYLPASLPPLITAVFHHGPESLPISNFVLDWQFWFAPLLLLFLCLTPMALVQGVPLSRALGQSLRLVWKRYLLVLALAVAAALISLAIHTPYYYVRMLIRDSWERYSLPGRPRHDPRAGRPEHRPGPPWRLGRGGAVPVVPGGYRPCRGGSGRGESGTLALVGPISLTAPASGRGDARRCR